MHPYTVSRTAATKITAALALVASLSLLLSGCANQAGGGYNPTTNANQLNQAVLDKQPIKNVVIAHINIGAPSRNYIKKSETMVDARIAAYLRANGYTILPQREFSQRWNNATLIYGDPVDPTTGRINTKTFIQIVQAVRDDMREKTDVEGFVFTDLIEHDAVVSGGMNHIARFNGVSRKPSLKGPGDGVSADAEYGTFFFLSFLSPLSFLSFALAFFSILCCFKM